MADPVRITERYVLTWLGIKSARSNSATPLGAYTATGFLPILRSHVPHVISAESGLRLYRRDDVRRWAIARAMHRSMVPRGKLFMLRDD